MQKRPDLAWALGENVRNLREQRNMTQGQLAKLVGIPRATWAHLESGGANPTLAVLQKVAEGLRVTFEELLAAPQSGARLYPAGSLPEKVRGKVRVRNLLPEPLRGVVMDRLCLEPKGRMIGSPHLAGTREYLTCEGGQIELVAAGQTYAVGPGDVVVFRGDQKHSYYNPGSVRAVGFSMVVLKPAGGLARLAAGRGGS